MRPVLSTLSVLCLAFAIALSPSWAPRGDPAVAGRGFSAARLNPDAVEALRSHGKTVSEPFPATASSGKKFNPTGKLVGSLTTAPEQKILVLFVDFQTMPPGGPTERIDLRLFDDMLFGTEYDPWAGSAWPGEYPTVTTYPTDRTLYNYLQQVSYGHVEMVRVDLPSDMGWTTVAHPYDYYTTYHGIPTNGFGPFPANVQGLVRDAVLAADLTVDFSQYAVGGAIPNLFVVYAGTGAEWSADPSLLWSHSWDLSAGTGLDGVTVDNVKINNYAMMPEVGGNLTGYYDQVSGPYPPTVGVYAHEYGHVLGLPDQYDYGYESEGTGIYSLMAGGSWNRYPDYPIFSANSPAHLDAWSKYRLGFVEPVEVTDAAHVTLPPAELQPVAYKMVVPNSDGLEYFLFENRQQVGFDQGLGRYGLGVHGLAIYHVDDTVLTRIYDRPNEAENWHENRSAGFRKAWTGETHYAIAIVQADDAWHLEHGIYWTGYEGDLFPGIFGRTAFGVNTAPNSGSYYYWPSDPKFGQSGVAVSGIHEVAAEEGNDVVADLAIVPWAPGKK